MRGTGTSIIQMDMRGEWYDLSTNPTINQSGHRCSFNGA
jgi:hypothetical protein